MNIQALIAILAGIAAIFGVSISSIIINLRRWRRYHKEKIKASYMLLGGSQSRLGIPISSIQRAHHSPFGTRGWLHRFYGNGDGVQVWDGEQHKHIIGVSIYSSKRGTFPTWGSIGEWYEKHDGTGGRLGFPTSPEQQISTNPKIWVQQFEGGTITSVYEQTPTIEYTTQKR